MSNTLSLLSSLEVVEVCNAWMSQSSLSTAKARKQPQQCHKDGYLVITIYEIIVATDCGIERRHAGSLITYLTKQNRP